MNAAVGGHHAGAVCDLLHIVAERTPEEVAQPSARLAEDRLRAAGVPRRAVRRRVDVQVALAERDDAELEADRPDVELVGDAERALDLVDRGVAMRLGR